MKRLTWCWLLGHSRGPVSDRVEVERISEYVSCRHVFCGCCGKRTDSFSLVRTVESGCYLPRGYGVAWLRWQTRHAVCMPVPLNLIAGIARLAWAWIKSPHGIVDSVEDAYAQGRADGYRQAIKDANS